MSYFNRVHCFSIAAMVCIVGASCNRNHAISPEGELLYPQPVSRALTFTDAVKLDFSQPARPYTPVIKKVDYRTLPTSLFDSSDFKNFPTAPPEIRFDPATIRDTIFNYDKLPSAPLTFKTSLLAAPVVTKLGNLQLNVTGKRPVFSIAEVLGTTPVADVMKARDGLLWIGTDKGLYKYDGKYLTHFPISGLLGGIFNITEDLDGQLWCATSGGSGVFCVNIRSGIVRQITRAQGAISNLVIRTVCDKNNRIWLSYLPENKDVVSAKIGGGGVAIIDQSKAVLKYFTSANGLSTDLATGMFADGNDVWIASPHGSLQKVDLQKNRISYYDSAHGFNLQIPVDIFVDKQKRIWAGGFAGKKIMLDLKQHLSKGFYEAQGFGNAFVGGFAEDWQGNIYIGTNDNVEVINSDISKMTTLSKANGLSGNDNTAIATDNLGQIWITTVNGLNMIGRNGYNISRFGKDSISTMMEDASSRVWVGTLTQGVKIIDSNGVVKQFSTAQGLSGNFIQIIVNIGGRMIISTNIGGLDMYDSSLTSTEHIGIAQGLNTDRITAVMPHSSGQVWLGGFLNNGVDLLDLNQRSIRHIGTEQGFKDSTVLDLKEDQSGNVWTSSGNSGIGVIDLKSAFLKHIKSPAVAALTTGLASSILMLDGQDNLWVGSADGLYIINKKRDSVTTISKHEGMLSNKVISLKEYHNHIYVGTNRGLQVIIPPAFSANHQWQIIGIDKGQGLIKQLSSFSSDLISKKGAYWWGDMGATIISNLDSLESSYSRPNTYISGISVLNQPLYFTNKSWPVLANNDTIYKASGDTFYTKHDYDKAFDIEGATWDSVAGSYNLPANLELSYTHNYLQFQYGQAGMGSEDTTWYRYMLEGVDKGWSDKTTSTTSMNYLNLSPGNYTFTLVSGFKNVWGSPVSFSFSILPPWWKTWWAYCVYALLIVVTLRTIISYRSRWLKEENQRLEKTIADRTEALRKSIKELEDTQSQLVQSEKMASLGELTAGIAHEIQNPLNFVNNFAEVSNELLEEMTAELKNNNTEEAINIAQDVKQNLEKILHHGRRADGIVKGMLQHSRSSGGSKEPTNINALADEYLRLAYHGLRAKDKSFNATLKTDFDQHLELVNVIPQDIGRVILNLITNAFYAVSERKKEQPEGFDPTVTVNTKQLAGKVEITVSDNGNGVPQKVLDKIFQPFFTTKPTGQGTGLGLSLSYDIIKAHGGELTVINKEHEGASFLITLPV